MNANRTTRQALRFISATILLASVPAFACGGGADCPCQIQQAAEDLTALETTITNNPMTTDAQTLGDQEFIREALADGAVKVALGRLAQQKSQRDDIKQFGQTMVEDHTMLSDQILTRIAKVIGAQEPKGLSKKDKQLVDSLQALSGSQFDQEYVKLMVKEHKLDLKKFTSEAQMTEYPGIKSAVEHGSNIISSHLDLIQQIAQGNATQDHTVASLSQTELMGNK